MLVLRVDGLNRLLHGAAHCGAPLEDLVGAHGVEPGPGLLGLDDGVVVAAVSHVDHEFAEAGNRDGHLGGMEVARDVEQPHLVDMAAVAFVDDLDAAGRDFERQPPLDLGRHQSFLQRHRDGADRAVTAHRQAAADLDEQHAEVAIGARGRVEDRTRHDVVAARLEHQGVADPIVLGQEDLALLGH